MTRWRCIIALATLAIAGCGGGKSPSQDVFTLHAGDRWVYKFTGTVTTTGSGSQTAKADQSTLTIQVNSTTATDLHGAPLLALDRTYDIELLDGTKVAAVQRLYVTQSASGTFVHGMNNSATLPLDPANDKFVPATTNPAYQFVYLPSPLLDGLQVSYTNPMGLTPAAGYSLTVGSSGFSTVTVPLGTFQAKPLQLNEAFSGFTLSNAAIAPSVGILGGDLTATLPTITIQGRILLSSR